MKKIFFSSILGVILLAGLGISGVAAIPGNGSSDFTDVLISFDRTPGLAEQSIVEKAGGSVKYSYTLVPAIAARIPSAALQGLERNPRIAAIEPDGIVWAIDYATELDNTWGVKHIQAGEVHQTDNFGAGVKVAVIDTGIDCAHTELNCAGGYNFIENNEYYIDDNGHGTHVAGTIAAARNGAGVVGVAPEVELYALKVLDAKGGGYFSDIIAAIEWAVGNGIQITNNSYGSSIDPGTAVKAAFDNSYNQGILHVAAAGNEGNPAGRGDSVGYPAKWDSVIAVAAIDKSNKRAPWSSTGAAVELSAPGVSIKSTWLNNGYAEANGTSMASPHVAGTAALVMAKVTAVNTEVREILRSTAQYLGSASQYGYGLVNALMAVEGESPLPPDGDEPPGEGEPEEKCPPGWQKRGLCN